MDLLAQQVFDAAKLDYTRLDHHRAMLKQLAKVSNSGITVFDLHTKRHVFASYNFIDLLGYFVDGVDDRVHPGDIRLQLQNGIKALHFFYAHKADIKDYKMISEYRIRNVANEYIRVIEQFSALEVDPLGNMWLSLSVIDLSPDQSAFKSVKCNIVNLRNNRFFAVDDLYAVQKDARLSPREIKILQLVKDGLLSKEISEQLFISVHTVNTHRQRILEKLNADNSMEAVRYASELGLLR
jgi:DNA-binding CsgD family transcriptional regulator